MLNLQLPQSPWKNPVSLLCIEQEGYKEISCTAEFCQVNDQLSYEYELQLITNYKDGCVHIEPNNLYHTRIRNFLAPFPGSPQMKEGGGGSYSCVVHAANSWATLLAQILRVIAYCKIDRQQMM